MINWIVAGVIAVITAVCCFVVAKLTGQEKKTMTAGVFALLSSAGFGYVISNMIQKGMNGVYLAVAVLVGVTVPVLIFLVIYRILRDPEELRERKMLTDQLEKSEKIKEQYENEFHERQEMYDEKLSEFQEKYEKEKKKQQESYKKEFSRQQEAYESKLLKLQEDSEYELLKLQQGHEQELINCKEGYEKQLLESQKEYEQKILQHQDACEKRLEEIDAAWMARERELLSEIDRLKEQISEQENRWFAEKKEREERLRQMQERTQQQTANGSVLKKAENFQKKGLPMLAVALYEQCMSRTEDSAEKESLRKKLAECYIDAGEPGKAKKVLAER